MRLKLTRVGLLVELANHYTTRGACPKHCDRGLIVVIVYYFQIWNKEEHNIIISSIICSHMGLMYIETLYT